MADILQFPKDKMAAPPQNEVELRASLEKVRNQFVTQAAVEIAFEVFRLARDSILLPNKIKVIIITEVSK